MITNDDSQIIYLGNNSTTAPYPVPFRFDNDGDLVVVVRDASGFEDPQVLATDYTVTGKGDPNGGSIKTTWAVPVTAHVSIVRIVPYTQLMAYEEADAFPAKSHERALDKMTMEIQQLARGLGDGSGSTNDVGNAFRLTEASGGIKSLPKSNDTMVGIDASGEAILRTPTNMLSWLGQVGTTWANATERANTRGAFAGQTGIQRDNWTLYVARSTAAGDWVPHLKESGVVISTNGTPTAKPNPAGDIVGTEQAQVLSNKTLNNPAIHNPTGMTGADVGLGNVDNTSDVAKPVSLAQEIRLQGKQDTAVKGFADGYPSLDGAGKIPIDQIPSSLTGGNAQFQGVWNATTNVPPIPAATTANNGFYYLTNVAGTSSAPTGSPVAYGVGDQVISNGSTWQRIPSSAAVTSVASRTGAIVLSKVDVQLNNVDNTSDVFKNAATGTLTNKTIKGSQNTLEVRLDSDVINNLPVGRLNGGTGAAANTWWCGDGSWKQPQGTGDVTGVPTSVDGELPVFADTGGKHIRGFTGATGFLIVQQNNACTTVAKIGPSETSPNFIHGLTEKLTPVEDDEAVIWDSVSGTLMRVKKKNLGVPVGTICDWAGRAGNNPDNVANACPPGWLICNNAQYPTATYPALFSVIGYGYGGSGANFRVPDTRGLVTMGRDYSEQNGDAQRMTIHGAARYTIGAGMGAQSIALNANEMPQHNHTSVTYFLGYHNAVTNGNYGLASINCGIPCGVGFNGSVMIFDGNARGGYIRNDGTDYRGANYAHNNTQPTVCFWKIIKY